MKRLSQVQSVFYILTAEKNRNRRVPIIKRKKKDVWQTVITFILQRSNMYIFFIYTEQEKKVNT